METILSMEALQERYKGFGGDGVDRKDLSDNLEQHSNTEINAFAEETNLSYGQALNLFSPMPNENGRPQDALLDCIAYRNLRTVEEDNIPASPACDFFDRGDANFALGVGYLQNLFNYNVGAGISRDRHYARQVVDSAVSRSDLAHPFNPENIGPLEKNQDFAPRVRIMHVIAQRRTILGDQYEAPVVSSPPTNTGLRQTTGGSSRPRYTLSTSSEVTRTTEIGYELEIEDKVRRSPRITMDAIAEVQIDKAMQIEDDIVIEVLKEVGKDLGAVTADYSASGGITIDDYIEMHLQPNNRYMITTIVGGLAAIAAYLGVDPYYVSSNRREVTPSGATYLDNILGVEFVGKIDTSRITIGTGTLAATDVLAFHRARTCDYIVEQRGTIQETYRENRTTSTIIQNLHNWALRLRNEAKTITNNAGNTRWRFKLA